MPTLSSPQVSVIVTAPTGKVLDFTGRLFVGEGNSYKIFPGIEEARDFAKSSTLAPSINFLAYDFEGIFIAQLPRA